MGKLETFYIHCQLYSAGECVWSIREEALIMFLNTIKEFMKSALKTCAGVGKSLIWFQLCLQKF